MSSSLPRDTSPGVSSAKVQELSTSNREFAFALYEEVSEGTDNLFFSPYSISVALAMTYAGAERRSEAEIAEALRFELPESQLHPAFNQLDLDLAQRAVLPQDQSGDGFELEVVNALFGQTGYPFLDPFLDTLAVNYGAGMQLLDFETEPDRSRALINDWVEGQTNNRIRDLLPQGTIDALTRLVLVNAIYFKASWLHPFDERETSADSFSRLDDSAVSVPMMHGTIETRYAAGDGYAAAELPYIGGQLAMTVIVPDEGRFEELEDGMSRTFFDAVVDDMHVYEVTLSLPKFSFSSSFELASPLEALGMVEPFSPGQADFTGMSSARDLYISAVQHQAFVDVSEQGTEAAAATAVVISKTSAPMQVELRVDRPFLFAIRDRPTGALLFLGRVTDPRA